MIENRDLKGDKLDWMRMKAPMAGLHLGGMESYMWEEMRGKGSPAVIKY
jgi:hypothetical protein